MYRPRPWAFGSRSPRYPMLKAYLAARPGPPVVPLGSPRMQTMALSATSAVSGLAVLGSGTHLYVAGILMVVGGALAFVGFRTKPPPPPTVEQQLAHRADAVVNDLKGYAYLHRAFHPGVGALLEECATYATRVRSALEVGEWSHREEVRENALAAAKVAMDEALVHAGATLTFTRPTRPIEHVSDALEDVGFGPLVRSEREEEPLPVAFRPIRQLAERLRELAERCETAATHRPEGVEEPVSAAFRRLDATLGEMRSQEEAERELRHGA